MAETQWLEYDELTFEFDSDIPLEFDSDIPLEFDGDISLGVDSDVPLASALLTIITMALGEDDPWPLEAEADVRVVSVSDLA